MIMGFVRGKQYYNDSALHEFIINQTFPRFSPTCFARRKGRQILIKKNRADLSRYNIIFPLATYQYALYTTQETIVSNHLLIR